MKEGAGVCGGRGGVMEKVRECGLKLSRDEVRRMVQRAEGRQCGTFRREILGGHDDGLHRNGRNFDRKAHGHAGVPQHVKNFRWPYRYEESAKLLAESLQMSCAAVSLAMMLMGA
jgi:hypothetical protein